MSTDDSRAHVKATTCPNCGRKLDAATSTRLGRQRPKPGDFSLCIGCAAVLRFDEELEPVLALPDDLLELHREDPEAFRHLAIARRAVQLVGPPPARKEPPQ